MAKDSGLGSLLMLGGIGAALWYFWPEVQTEAATLGINLPSLPAATPASTSTTAIPAGAQGTNYSPSVGAAGATPVGTSGCYQYAGTISCPPGVSPPAGSTPANNCQPGYSPDAAGICTLYSDAELLAGINSIQWSGLNDIPTEQIARIDPQILATYTQTPGVTPGSVLAYMLGLGGSNLPGTQTTGSDGNIYVMTDNMWVRQNKGTLSGIRGARLGRVAAAVPITNQILIRASWDPDTAAILGSDPRGLLTVSQWNYFYSQASGVLQTQPTSPVESPGALINAEQYQALRKQAGLPVRLGTLRPADPRMFPLGAIRTGPVRQPFITPQNNTIYRVPGRGAVVTRSALNRMGLIFDGGGTHRWAKSPYPRPVMWRRAE